MWRLRVVHTTGYAYQSPVTASYNEARLTPRSDTRQNVILNRVETIPATRSYRYIDYWGTAVTAFDLHAPHADLTVTSSSVVETERPEPPVAEVSWSDLDSEAVIDRFDELLRPTPHTPPSKRVTSVTKKIAKTYEPAEAVVAAAKWVRGELDYLPGTARLLGRLSQPGDLHNHVEIRCPLPGIDALQRGDVGVVAAGAHADVLLGDLGVVGGGVAPPTAGPGLNPGVGSPVHGIPDGGLWFGV